MTQQLELRFWEEPLLLHARGLLFCFDRSTSSWRPMPGHPEADLAPPRRRRFSLSVGPLSGARGAAYRQLITDDVAELRGAR